MNLFDPEFYPTPAEVIKKMIEPYGPRLDSATILEPSAGNGAIVDFLCNTGIEVQFETSKGQTYIHTMRAKAENVYCIEKNPDLRMILQQKKYRVLDSDFLSFAPEHRFNLLTMNPSILRWRPPPAPCLGYPDWRGHRLPSQCRNDPKSLLRLA